MKKNIRWLICRKQELFRDDGRIEGIVSDQIGKTNSDDILRKIVVYVEPATGRKFR